VQSFWPAPHCVNLQSRLRYGVSLAWTKPVLSAPVSLTLRLDMSMLLNSNSIKLIRLHVLRVKPTHTANAFAGRANDMASGPVETIELATASDAMLTLSKPSDR